MKIGIIVYSQSGHTLLVAEKLKQRLAALGHEAEIERVTIAGESRPGAKDIEFINVPRVDRYDTLVFASLVQGFTLAIPMAEYLKQLPPLQGKKAACFVTKQLPSRWTGGNRAVGQMKKICEAKGAAFRGAAIVYWAESRRDKSIAECVNCLSDLLLAT